MPTTVAAISPPSYPNPQVDAIITARRFGGPHCQPCVQSITQKLHGKLPKKVGLGEEFWIELCGRNLPAKKTKEGIRAVTRDQPIEPGEVQQYLESKFATDLAAVQAAMTELAEAYKPEELQEQARSLYEQFRPEIPRGKKGWGAKGMLDISFVRSLAKRV